MTESYCQQQQQEHQQQQKKKKKNYPDGNFLEFYSDTCLLGAMDA